MDILKTYNGQINLVALNNPGTFAPARPALHICQTKNVREYAKKISNRCRHSAIGTIS